MIIYRIIGYFGPVSTWKPFTLVDSEHASLSDHKRSRGQRRADSFFSLHRQRTQEGQFPPLAPGRTNFLLTMKYLDAKLEVNLNVLKVGLRRVQASAFFLEMSLVLSRIKTENHKHYHANSAKMKKERSQIAF